MPKLVYDPVIFNHALDSFDIEKHIIATYYIEDTPGTEFIDHLVQMERVALEGSVGSWVEVKEETPEVREMLAGKLVGYYQVPAPPGTKACVAQFAFPTACWDRNPNFPMMLLTFAGNAFVFANKFRLLDVAFPNHVTKIFTGPKFGVEGIRKLINVYDRPLILHILKPKMGMTPEQTAAQCYESAMGGVDLIKDDEMTGDVYNSRFEDRLGRVIEALDKAEKATGKKVLYFISVTDEVDRLVDKARKAVKAGANALLVSYPVGYSGLWSLAKDPQVNVPILLHCAHSQSQLQSINYPTLAKLSRLAGADIFLIASNWSRYVAASLEESVRSAQVMLAPFHNIRRSWPMPGGGMYPGLAKLLIEEIGPDMIIAAGGGLAGHPMGTRAGARAWRQAIDAVMSDTPLMEAAKQPGHEELKVALETWGILERPTTPWGYISEAFRPKSVRF